MFRAVRVCVFIYIVLLGFFKHTVAEETDSHADHGHGEGTKLDPFLKITQLYNVSESEFNTKIMETLVHNFSTIFECNKNSTDMTACSMALCLNTTELLAAHGVVGSNISEEVFANISITLLHLAANSSRYKQIKIQAGDVQTHFEQTTQSFTGNNVTSGFKVGLIQEFLEHLKNCSHGEDDDHHEDDDEDHAADEDEDHAHAEEDSDHDDHESNANLDIEPKCLGADILFDQLGWTLPVHMDTMDLGHLASLIVYHLLNGAHVARHCRQLPRHDYFTETIFKKFAASDTMSETEFEKLLTELKIGSTTSTAEPVDDHDDHSHRRRRSISMEHFQPSEPWNSSCFNVHQLFAIFSVPESGVTHATFTELCPSLIQQVTSQTCVQPAAVTVSTDSSTPLVAERYGYGTIATVIVCLCSVVGAIFLKCTTESCFNTLMSLFLGLAVGSLAGDAVLHLIPIAFGLHAHEEHDHDHDTITIEPYLLYSGLVLIGIYVFYLFEKLISSLQGESYARGHSHSAEHATEKHKYQVEDVGGVVVTKMTYTQNGDSTTQDTKTKIPGPDNFSSLEEQKFPDSETKPSGCRMPALALMIVVGDGVHNFADGMAIGAAFTQSISVGLSTTIAVFCHEFPHELGDFAVLLSSGVSFKKALLLNVLSSLTAMAGLYVGLGISTDDTVRQCIMGLTAGMFMYIALVNMLPQLLEPRKTDGKKSFILNNVGILIGVGIMLVLAIFEEKIKI